MSPSLNWQALAEASIHPLKLATLQLMLDGAPRSPKMLSDELGEKLGNISYHVRQLVADDFLVLESTEPRRGALEHFYVLNGKHPAVEGGPRRPAKAKAKAKPKPKAKAKAKARAR